jgi:branched-chain amino acid transport system ATP-binding protein
VRQNLWLGGYHPDAKPHRTETLAQVYDMFPRLRERAGQLAHSLSGGEQQMLALGRGLMSRPRLLMVDEPFLGLAPAIVQEMKDAFERINADGVSILFIEQNVQVALNMSSRGYILESGRLALAGTSADLLESAEVKRIFLGG